MYNKYRELEYNYRLDLAIDALDEIFSNIKGDYDIHNIIDDLSCRFDVEKSDLLDHYDNN